MIIIEHFTGNFTAQMSSYDNNDKIMMADLPARGVAKMYSLVGDIFVYACIALSFRFL